MEPPRNASNPNHSHVCGITRTMGDLPENDRESFPRMWDHRTSDHGCSRLCRIIPTYVGSPRNQFNGPVETTNHSHVCGITSFIHSAIVICPESFPRMWDHLLYSTGVRVSERIIPTYVGSPHVSEQQRRQSANHSHVCGITWKADRTSGIVLESFPRMWDHQIHAPS